MTIAETLDIAIQTLNAAVAPVPEMTPEEIGVLTKEEFLQLRNPTKKMHPSESYDATLAKLNEDRDLFEIGTNDKHAYYQNKRGYLVYYNNKDRPVVAVIHAGIMYHDSLSEVPKPYFYKHGKDYTKIDVKSVKPVKYIADFVHLVSNAAMRNRENYPVLLQNVIISGEPMQLRAQSVPVKNAGTAIAVLNGEGHIVAEATDEWGATLLRVAREYRNKGLGKQLGKYWYTFNPGYTSGGFTPSGMNNAIRLWEDRVHEFMSNGWYSALVRDGVMTTQRVKDITNGLSERSAKPAPTLKPQESKADIRVYLDDINSPVSFVIYDSRFLTDNDEKHIKAYGFFRSSPNVGSFLYTIDYDNGFRQQATKVALMMAKINGTPVYIGPGYGDMLELSDIPGVETDGSYAYLKEDALPLKRLAKEEKDARKAIDPYNEVESLLIESAESKWAR